jgi:MFS family permease
MCVGIGIYGYAYFLPVILAGMGHSTGRVFLLCAPPAICCVPFAIGLGWLADKTHMRAPYIAFSSVVSIIGYALIGYHKNNGVRYAALTL